MGVVYEAWDERLERRVALKVLHGHLTSDPHHRERLLREARLAARVEHPNVVRMYSVREEGDSLALEMEFIDGTPLHTLIHGQKLSTVQAADLLRQALDALAACHARGVLHGDLKPANLMVTREGRVVLTDFGIARAMLYDDTCHAPSVSLSGPIWGTPQYCPPEAWDGLRPTPAWDLYALGVVVHEALTGHLPFNAQTPAVLMREKLERPHESIASARSDLSAELASLIDDLKCTSAAERVASAEEALARLRLAPESHVAATPTQPFEHTPVPVTGTPIPHRTTKPSFGMPYEEVPALPTASPWRWVPLGAGLALAGAGLILFVSSAQQKPLVGTPAATVAEGKPGEILGLRLGEDVAYFSYDDGVRGRELWCGYPDGRIEMVADINPGPPSSNPRRSTPRGGSHLMFAATTELEGEEPWYCGRGKNYHTVKLLRDILPGPMSSEPIFEAQWGATVMFYATTLKHGSELWLSNTQEGQTGLLLDANEDDGDSRPLTPKVLADEGGAYFVACDKTTWQLWRYHHDDASVEALGVVPENTGEMVLLGAALFLGAPDASHGHELWRYLPESGPPTLFADLAPGAESSSPEQFFAWNDRLYFQAASNGMGAELWVTDGTREGCQMLADINPGANSSAPYGFIAVGKWLYFRAYVERYGNELWRTDGTPGGTTLAADLRPGADSSNPYNLVTLGGSLFFTADDGALGEELWMLDPEDMESGPKLVADLWTGATGAEPHDLQPMSEFAGIFAYKVPDGENLMKLELSGGECLLTPYTGLRRPQAQHMTP